MPSKDPDRRREISKAWRHANRDRVNERKRRYYRQHREAILEKARLNPRVREQDKDLNNERARIDYQKHYEARRTRQNEYARRRHTQRRTDWLEANGPCAYCGSRDRLEVDHINPSQKEIKAGKLWPMSQERRDKELAKCQVLCYACHNEKSSKEKSDRMSKKGD